MASLIAYIVWNRSACFTWWFGKRGPQPAQRFKREAFLSWAARLKQKSGAEIRAVYAAC